jgi:hypothetical protein
MPLGFPAEGFDSGLAYAPHADDVFVCTYPKCGTTWVQYIVYLLMHAGQPLARGESLAASFPHLEEVGKDVVDAQPAPRLIKTHLPREMTPFNREARFIYVARNPFDCAASFYHHTRGFPQHYDFVDGTFADFFECFIRGEVDFGDYFDNLLSWHRCIGTENFMFLTYEEIKADTRAAVLAIGEFLGSAARACARDAAAVDRILAASSFRSMRTDQRRWASARPADMPEFVRSGTVGDWRSLFASEQTDRLIAKFDARTQGTNAASLWPDIMDAVRRTR